MKGRPRPASLKTDVIKSRNRSKGKSTSKDRNGIGGPAVGTPKRSESTSRSREEGIVGRKSAPGGAEEELVHEMGEGRESRFGDHDSESNGRKARRTSQQQSYPTMGYSYPYPYPYPPHMAQPYPPRSRSRSSEGRRTQSLDARGRTNPYNYHPPPPEAYYQQYAAYPQPLPQGYAPFPHPYPHAHPMNTLQPFHHAQSDSRSRSPVESQQSEPNSRKNSESPPNLNKPQPLPPHSNYYPNYHLHQPYANSPLSKSPNASPSNGGITLAPIARSRANSPRSSFNQARPDSQIHLPSISAVGSSNSALPSLQNYTATTTRRPSVSSHSNSGSSEGVRSPEATMRGAPSLWRSTNGEDERRGRPERRFDDPIDLKGKSSRSIEEVDELEDEPVHLGPAMSAMNGVETGVRDLRMADYQRSPVFGATTSLSEDSRSRSSGKEERGRSRGGHIGSSSSRNRLDQPARHSSNSSGGSRNSHAHPHSLIAAEAEIARLKTKVSELTFLNGLMQSRLAMLESPGKVPTRMMESIDAAETPRQSDSGAEEATQDEEMGMEGDGAEDVERQREEEELQKYGVSVAGKDAETRRKLLNVLRQS